MEFWQTKTTDTKAPRGVIRRARSWLPLLLFLSVAVGLDGFAQSKSRAEEILQARRDKQASLWPEVTSPIAEMAIDLMDRGLLSGIESGSGSNGWQFPVLGGMRSGQGFSLGGGYRRTDIWRDRIGYRFTARGTLQKAYMFDGEIDFQSLRTEKTFLTVYSKYENSPQMDYYGPGANSQRDDLTNFRLEDVSVDARGGVALGNLRAGFDLGLLKVHTGPGTNSDSPSTDSVFPPLTTPGVDLDTWFSRWGAFVQFNYLDNPRGPRSGGLYAANYHRHDDRRAHQFTFSGTEFEAQQYIPYFNKTRVIALRARAWLTYTDDMNRVPFYLQPTLGGNDDLRGFERYRFYGNHSILMTAEHRWHSFSNLDMALFVDAGKVALRRADIDFSGLRVSYGIGFRFKMREAYFMRVDLAASEEGFRFMWTFSDIFQDPSWF